MSWPHFPILLHCKWDRELSHYHNRLWYPCWCFVFELFWHNCKNDGSVSKTLDLFIYSCCIKISRALERWILCFLVGQDINLFVTVTDGGFDEAWRICSLHCTHEGTSSGIPCFVLFMSHFDQQNDMFTSMIKPCLNTRSSCVIDSSTACEVVLVLPKVSTAVRNGMEQPYSMCMLQLATWQHSVI